MADFESLPLDKQNELLRAYQLGKTDVDPRNGMKRAEAVKHHAELNAEFEADQLKKAEAAQEKVPQPQAPAKKDADPIPKQPMEMSSQMT